MGLYLLLNTQRKSLAYSICVNHYNALAVMQSMRQALPNSIAIVIVRFLSMYSIRPSVPADLFIDDTMPQCSFLSSQVQFPGQKTSVQLLIILTVTCWRGSVDYIPAHNYNYYYYSLP